MTGSHNKNIGFTLVELLVVLLVVALLASLAAPVVSKSIQQAKESTLQEDLHVMRKAIDDYYADNGKYPESLEILVHNHYIRKVPIDPLTTRNDSWVLTHANDKSNGVIDVHSGSELSTSEGIPYQSW